jgi:hypothetical protein
VAARRLVAVMLVLLALSTIAAVLLPAPGRRNPVTPGHMQSRGSTAHDRGQAGLLLVTRMRISNRRPKIVRIERGDQLRLEVAAPFGDDVEIRRLGLTGTGTPFAPAQFDLFARHTGSFPVRAEASGRLVGWLLVGLPGTGRCGVSTPATPQGRARAPACAPRGRHGSQGYGQSAPPPSGAGGRRHR